MTAACTTRIEEEEVLAYQSSSWLLDLLPVRSSPISHGRWRRSLDLNTSDTFFELPWLNEAKIGNVGLAQVLGPQVFLYFLPPASWSAFEYVCMRQESIAQRRDGGGVAGTQMPEM